MAGVMGAMRATSTTQSDDDETKRPRGRPRVDIDTDAVADTAADLFAEGGLDAVSIHKVADRLSVSRATLYRSVPTKEALLGVLFERSTRELMADARGVLESTADPADRLVGLVNLQSSTAVRMRQYMPVFFDGGGLPPDVMTRWHDWSRSYEAIWVDVVKDCMVAGILEEDDPNYDGVS